MTSDNSVDTAETVAHPDLDNFSLAEPDFLKCPYPFYEEIRNQGEVYRIPGTLNYIVARDDLVRQVLSDPEHFSSAVGTPATPASEAVQSRLKEIRAGGWERTPTMILGDPPDQTRERRIITPFVTARAADGLRPEMERIVAELLDSVSSEEIVDFNNAVSIPFSVKVICRVLDTAEDMWETVLKWTDADSAAYGVFLSDEERIQNEMTIVEMQQYYVNKVHELRERPKENHVLSALAHARVPDPQRPGSEAYLDDSVVAEMARQIQTGGNETSRKYFCDMMLLLADHPAEWEAYRRDRSRGSQLIEETLRMSTQLQSSFRVAREGAKIGGAEIPDGAVVMPFFGSANRDPQRFECPAEFRPGRENGSQHLTFSHGLHTCPGNTIARVEADVLLNLLADRWEKFEVVDRDKIEYEPSFMIRSIKEFRLRPTLAP